MCIKSLFQNNVNEFHIWALINTVFKMFLSGAENVEAKSLHSFSYHVHTGWVCAAGMCRQQWLCSK